MSYLWHALFVPQPSPHGDFPFWGGGLHWESGLDPFALRFHAPFLWCPVSLEFIPPANEAQVRVSWVHWGHGSHFFFLPFCLPSFNLEEFHHLEGILFQNNLPKGTGFEGPKPVYGLSLWLLFHSSLEAASCLNAVMEEGKHLKASVNISKISCHHLTRNKTEE